MNTSKMRIMNMLNETSKRTWKKVCESMRMNGTDSDFVQWVDETKAIVAECGDAAFSEIAAMSGVDTYDLETLVYFPTDSIKC